MVDSLVADLHGLDGVGGEADAGSNLTEMMGGLIDGDRNISSLQGNCKGQTSNSSSNNCNFEWFLSRHGDGGKDFGVGLRLDNM